MGIGDVVLHVLRAARDVGIVLHLVAGASEQFVLMVLSFHRTPDLEVVERTVARNEACRLSGRSDFILVVCILIGAEHLLQLGGLLPAIGNVEAYLCLAFLTRLGGNDDNAVGTTGTVDSGRGCILKNVDALDFRGSDVADRSYREAIDNVERRVVLRKRTATTHTDLDVGIGGAFGGGDIHTGHLTGECF